MGIGIGMVVACLLLLPFYPKDITPGEIEIKAKEMGMGYPDEIKALPNIEEGGQEK